MNVRAPRSGAGRARRTLLLLVFAAALFALAFFVTLVLRAYGRLSDEELQTRFSSRDAFTAARTAVASTRPATAAVLTGDDPALGAADAAVTIVEFGDFACPYSRQAFPTVKTILEQFGDRVRFQYRDFPVHDGAETVAAAATCAAEQGKFWQYHDLLFINQERQQAEDLEAYARQAGLDVAAWRACTAGQDAAREVEQDVADGAAVGVGGTPTWFVNGRRIEGALDERDFTKLIEYALKGKLRQ